MRGNKHTICGMDARAYKANSAAAYVCVAWASRGVSDFFIPGFFQ